MFLQLLADYGQQPLTDHSLEQATKSLRKAYLDFASHTPDNLATAQQFEYGRVANPDSEATEQGLVLKSQGALVSSILWHAYGESEIPDSVAKAHPTLTRDEWNEVLRIAQMTLQAAELNDKK